jgi:glutathione S-transferase
MSLKLYYHPLSSYSWKALIALYEIGTPFDGRILDQDHRDHITEWAALWPLQQFPVLRDEARDVTVVETSVIIEYLSIHYPGTFAPVPTDADVAIEVRTLDRIFDNYIMTSMQAFVSNKLRPEGARDAMGEEKAGKMLATTYDMLEVRLAGRTWAAGEAFSLADCAAAPSLFYADKIVPFRGSHPVLGRYLDRLEARPSFAKALADKEPYWQMFPFADGPAVD